MASRLRAKTCGFQYPTSESLPIVKAAGGLSKLSAEQRAQVAIKTVAIGDWCDDMPIEAQADYLALGAIEIVTVPDYEPADEALA